MGASLNFYVCKKDDWKLRSVGLLDLQSLTGGNSCWNIVQIMFLVSQVTFIILLLSIVVIVVTSKNPRKFAGLV